MVSDTFHERVLDMSERLVREHRYGREILASVLDSDNAPREIDLADEASDDEAIAKVEPAAGQPEDPATSTLRLDDGGAADR